MAFEQFLGDHVFTHLLRTGAIVRLDKVHPEIKPVDRHGGEVHWRQAAVSGTDWIGMLPGGVYLAMEATSTEEDRLPRRALSKERIAHLNVAAAHGVALLLVEFRAIGRRFAVPWKAAPWRTVRTAQSLYPSDLSPWPLNHWSNLADLLSRRTSQAA